MLTASEPPAYSPPRKMHQHPKPNNINWTPEIRDELVKFITEKTGAKSFVLGLSDNLAPCDESQQGIQCDGHWYETMSHGVAPAAFQAYTYGMYMDLAQGMLHQSSPKGPTSTYESKTIQQDTHPDGQ